MNHCRCTLLAVLGTLLPVGCGPGGESRTSPTTDFGFQKSVPDALIDQGRAAYDTYCVGCHGAIGDGKGEAAVFLDPKPRNFQLANFKFSSTRSGQLPTDEDLKRTINEGLKGSAMPGWDLLPTRTVEALVAYIKTFSPKWTKRRPAAPVPMLADPYRSLPDKEAALQLGEVLYHGFATCWTCHPSYVSKDKINEHLVAMENPTRDVFRDHLFESEGKLSAEGEMVYPPDFRRDFVRAGTQPERLYRSIAAGITGTAMPTWIDSMEIPSEHGDVPLVRPADLWALAYYVHSLIIERPAKFTDAAPLVRDRPLAIYLHGPPPPPEADAKSAEEDEFLDEEDFEEEEEFEED